MKPMIDKFLDDWWPLICFWGVVVNYNMIVSVVRLAIDYFRDFIEEARNLSASMEEAASSIKVGDMIGQFDEADKVCRVIDIIDVDGRSLVVCQFEERPIIEIGGYKYPLKLDKMAKDWKFETND